MGDGINRFTSLFRGTSQGSTVKGNVQGTQKINQASYSNGTPELSEQGYQKYNIEDAGEIYISKVPERALFNEGEPVFVKAQPGVIVGMYRDRKSVV